MSDFLPTDTTWKKSSGGGGGVNSVTGTANRITVGGTATDPIVNIAATYVGQASITTLGTIGTGVWQGTAIANAYIANTAVASLSGTNTGDQTSISGNAGSATVLATARAIYGANFDGSAAISGPIIGTYGGTGVNNSTRTITIAGNVVTVGAFSITLTATNTTALTLPTTGTLATLAGAETFTNKRNTKRTVAVTQSATPTINTDNMDVASITGLAQAITSMTTNLSGTPSANDYLQVQITDDGTARAIAWGASFVASTVALPVTTVISTMLRVFFQREGSTWTCIGVV